MLPYLKLQLGYVLLSGCLAGLVWWASGRVVPGRRPGLRFGAALGLLGTLSALGYAFMLQVLGTTVSSGFMVIAWCFYAGTLWLPLASAVNTLFDHRLRRPVAFLLPLLAVGLGVEAVCFGPNRLELREETVAVPGWSASAEPLRIVHLSDLQTVGPCERQERALEQIAELDPDLIVFTGDYMAGPFFDTGPALRSAREFVSRLSAPLGVVVVGGHSENHIYRKQIFEDLDLIYLRNQEHRLELSDGRVVSLFGLDSAHPDLASLDLLDEDEELKDAYRVVISHVPDVSPRLAGRAVDLHMAGHTHGGQVVVPLLGPPMTLSNLPRRYARGLHRFGDHWLNVSAGIGMEGNHAPRIRFLCPPEVVLLTLEGSAEIETLR